MIIFFTFLPPNKVTKYLNMEEGRGKAEKGGSSQQYSSQVPAGEIL